MSEELLQKARTIALPFIMKRYGFRHEANSKRLVDKGEFDSEREIQITLAALAEKDAVIERLRVANGILEDALQEAGDDYPGSSMQEWCVQQISRASQALADLDGAR